MQCPLDAFGIARDYGEVGFCRLVRLGAALFPIPQSAKRNVVARGELLLSQREGAAEGLEALDTPPLGPMTASVPADRFYSVLDAGFTVRPTQRK